MRIGMITDAYKPYISGVTNYIALNKKQLESLGHEVFVFTFGDTDFQDDEANIIRSRGLPLMETGYYINFSYSRPARRLLYTMDVVHVHHPFQGGQLALRYCRPRGIPIVFTNHSRYDLYAQIYVPLLGDLIGETMLQSYLPRFCRACDLVIAPSAGMRQIMREFGVDSPIEVIPNGVDLSLFYRPNQPRSRAEFGLSDKDVVVIYVGRLGPEKNLPFLLRAFAGLAETFENAHLLLVGDGSERENLEDRAARSGIAERVHFTGLVPYEQLPSYLALGDIFATASISEVHPLSVIEAMAAGLPVVGITSPGVGDTIVDGVTGYLASHDLAAFTARLARLVAEANLRRQMGKAAQKEARRYDIQQTCQTVLGHYRRLAAASRRPKSSLRARLTRLIDRWSG